MRIVIHQRRVICKDNGPRKIIVHNQSPNILVSKRGPQGPPGPPSSVTAITLMAGENLSALRVVYINPDNGKAYYASNTDLDNIPNITGLTTNAATADNSANVQTNSIVTDNGWSWNPDNGKNLYLGANGQITQTIPTTGAWVKIGFVAGPNKIFLTFNDPVILV